MSRLRCLFKVGISATENLSRMHAALVSRLLNKLHQLLLASTRLKLVGRKGLSSAAVNQSMRFCLGKS